LAVYVAVPLPPENVIVSNVTTTRVVISWTLANSTTTVKNVIISVHDKGPVGCTISDRVKYVQASTCIPDELKEKENRRLGSGKRSNARRCVTVTFVQLFRGLNRHSTIKMYSCGWILQASFYSTTIAATPFRVLEKVSREIFVVTKN